MEAHEGKQRWSDAGCSGAGGKEMAANKGGSTPVAAHYGIKPGHFETLKIHFPTSEGVNEVSERANE